MSILHRRFNTLGLWLRVAMATAVPVLGLLWFSGSAAIEQWRLSRELEGVRQLTELSDTAGSLVDELQKERGISSGYLSSGGVEFGGQLLIQRHDTDTARRRFTRVAADIALTPAGLKLAGLARETSQIIAHSLDCRSGVDSATLSLDEMFGHYTDAIDRLLRLVGAMTALGSGQQIRRLSEAYESLLLVKEHAGQERALGTVGFVVGGFEPALGRRFLTLGAAQEGFLESFRHVATREQLDLFNETMRSPVVVEYERLRELAGAGPTGVGAVEAGHWFDTATARIALLKRVEDSLNHDLAALATRLSDGARNRFFVYLLALLMAVAATIVAAWVILRDLDARQRTAEVLRAHEQLLGNFIHAATDGFALFDADLRLIEVNQASMRLIPAGRTKEDFLGKSLLDLNPSLRENARYQSYLDVLATGEPFLMDDFHLPHDLGGRRLSVKVFKVGKGLGLIHTDVTRQKDTEDHLRVLATTDPLTGAVNRRRFFEIGQEELQRAKRHGRDLSVISLDIDHFKAVNDNHGHDIGDLALVLLAKTSTGLLRSYDTFGRLGGEEFSILLPETSREIAATTADRLRRGLSDMPIPIPTGELRLTVSLGVAGLESGDTVLDDLLKRADVALYEAKAHGRNRVRVDAQPHEIVQ